jgi:hypothetical protein
MDQIAQSYLLLALYLDRHVEGFVDAYFGPPKLKAQAQAGEPRSLGALADDARQLLAAVEASDYDPQRRDFLCRQVRAMTAVIRNLSGQHLGFIEEVELYFDITPGMTHEAVFAAAHEELDRLLPGDGALFDRLVAWRKRLEMAPDRIMPVFELARQETRRRTLAFFDLPEGEELSLRLVKDQPWAAYNWYLGDLRSRIELNTDLPARASSAVPLLAHEAYAGHHTEHAIKEAALYRSHGRAEHCIQLLLAPECVLSEGIADSALDVIWDREDRAAFLRDELYPAAGLPDIDVGLQMQIEQASRALRSVVGNAALLLHRDSRPPGEVQRYVEQWGLSTPKEAVQSMKFIQNPLFRSYIFNYAMGQDLLAPLLAGPTAVANFRRLLSEPFTPTQIRDWLAEQV